MLFRVSKFCLLTINELVLKKKIMVDTASKTGYISQIIGPVVDIQFPSGYLPKVYNAVI